MFFQESELATTKRTTLATLPRTPETGWTAPRDWPDLRQAIGIGFDFEVKENDFKRGPGWSRGKASICGGSLFAKFRDGTSYKEYRPIRHEVDTHLNLDARMTIAYWKAMLETPHIPKFGANLIYDIGNATDEDIWVKGDLHDCQFAEAILTEEEEVNLDHVANKYLKLHKQTDLLYQWCAQAYGGEPTSKQRENIYRASPKLVGPYGEEDAFLPYAVCGKQYAHLVQQGLWDVYRMECDMIPMLVMMRKIGCRIDIAAAEQMYITLSKEIVLREEKIYNLTKRRINVNASNSLSPAYDAVNVVYPWTAGSCDSHHLHNKECGGQPSFTAPWLMDQSDPLSELILDTRRMYKLRDTFIKSYILDSHVNGRIYGQFHPLRNEGSRGETGGTSTGRYSSSTPDLQNIPSRTPLGRKIMEMWLPDEGHLCWQNGDYSQVEYRTAMHFAIGPKSDEFRQKYIDNPRTDYHNMAQKVLFDSTGIYIPRKAEEAANGNFPTGRMTIKEFNFGNLFGMGLERLCHDAHCAVEKGKLAQDAYFQAMPWIKPSQKAFTEEAKRLGYITTILGRRSRFDLWEAMSEWDEKNKRYKRTEALPYTMAVQRYGQIQRAGVHRALPCRVQGSAADLLKKAFWICFKQGVFNVIGLPKITVHDAVGHSVIDQSKEQNEAHTYYHWVMEHAIQFRVPIVFDMSRGANWGLAK